MESEPTTSRLVVDIDATVHDAAKIAGIQSRPRRTLAQITEDALRAYLKLPERGAPKQDS
jgi:hypothetical protein